MTTFKSGVERFSAMSERKKDDIQMKGGIKELCKAIGREAKLQTIVKLNEERFFNDQKMDDFLEQMGFIADKYDHSHDDEDRKNFQLKIDNILNEVMYNGLVTKLKIKFQRIEDLYHKGKCVVSFKPEYINYINDEIEKFYSKGPDNKDMLVDADKLSLSLDDLLDKATRYHKP